MLIAALVLKAPSGKINSTLPSSEIIFPPAGPISLLTRMPSGAPMAVESGRRINRSSIESASIEEVSDCAAAYNDEKITRKIKVLFTISFFVVEIKIECSVFGDRFYHDTRWQEMPR